MCRVSIFGTSAVYVSLAQVIVAAHPRSPIKYNPLKVFLMGPDDLGAWFLADENANSWQVVNSNEDHIPAAELYGWKRREELTSEDAVIAGALEFLLDHVGDQITAPRHIAEYFEK